MSQQTAKSAITILEKKNLGFFEPTKKQRINLSVAFAKKNMVLYGKAFDVIKSKKKINFNDEKDISKNLESIIMEKMNPYGKMLEMW